MKIKLGNGIGQDCTIFRLNFYSCLRKYFKRTDCRNKRIRINGEHLSHLQFVDDILIFSGCPKELKDILKHLTEVIINVESKINLKNTKVLLNSFEPKMEIVYNNTEVALS